ncbi:MAG: cytochrome P450 [Marinomonas primoryensis]|jgi:cytochrome P450
MEKMLSKDPMPTEILEIYSQGYEIRDALLVTDGETHDRHRKIITTAFSRKRLMQLAPLLDRRIDSLLDKTLPKGRIAFREELAKLVPLLVTEEQLRIPKEDMEMAKEWSEILSSNFGGIPKSMEKVKQEAHMMLDFQKYFAEKIENEIALISAGIPPVRDDDLLFLMANAISEPNDPMDMHEAISFLINLFPATHDTTTSSMMACMHRFTANPDAQEKIAENPAYISKLIEESMRHEAPVRAFWRRALSDVDLGGVKIPKDSWIMLRTSSAHRDENAFENADEFNIDRKSRKTHLGFGTGIHICAGRFFARHIISRVIGRFSEKATNFRFSDEGNDFSHIPNVLAAGYRELHIEFDPK